MWSLEMSTFRSPKLGIFFSMGEILIPKRARGKLPSPNSSPAKRPPRGVGTQTPDSRIFRNDQWRFQRSHEESFL